MPIEYISKQIKELPLSFNLIDCINWQLFPYKPKTEFKLIHLYDGFYLHFKVHEKWVIGLTTTDNGAVYNDSCVEFFIDPAEDGSYYNFEFNCIGTTLLGFGSSRNDREFAPINVIKNIIRKASLGNKIIESPLENTIWELELIIPFTCLYNHTIDKLNTKSFRCNFYKCANKNPQTHYLTWNPVNTNTPDFHRPDFFGNTITYESIPEKS
ncbi:MAG: carbohydrate-binding family 9-like protein [Spirochaetota bacterium]|nr:carbohydrate-binding family 9-like protein [Spirochaetota bacterium]